MSIGIVTTVGTYEHHLPGWCASVRNLNTKPDNIVIAAHHPKKVKRILKTENITATVIAVNEEFQLPRYLDGQTITVKETFLLSHYLNRAIAACDTDWIAWIGADDRYRPHALDGLNNLDADILQFGIQIGGDGKWYGGKMSECAQYNPVACGSPFRRWIWEQRPFQEHLFPYEDWGFWISAHHLGARARMTGRIDYDYTVHSEQWQQSPDATTAIRNWVKQLNE
jgi:hypothetical protein